MKKIISWFGKAFIAGIIAFLAISGFCYFYSNIPVHYTSKTGATDYYWDQYAFACRGTEGFAYTRTDDNGYINTYPKDGNEIDILVMGSSHAEGYNVNSDENLTYRLNQKFEENGEGLYAYNIGTSGHTIERCFNNLQSAIETFSPTEYVVIETASIAPSIDLMKDLYDGTFEKLASYDSGLIYQLQKSDFLRLTYSQLSNLRDNNKSEEPVSEEYEISEYELYLDAMMRNGSSIAEKNSCKLVVLYIPEIKIDYTGEVVREKPTEEEVLFKSLCEKYDIEYIDMIDSFIDLYDETHILPRGFSNTAVGKGHTNKYGHACIAEELYKHMGEIKE